MSPSAAELDSKWSGMEVAADGSMLSPSSGVCGTGRTAASLSLVVAKSERAWQDSQIDE